MSSDPERERIRAEFIAQRGYWRPWVETMLEHNPGFVEQYARYAGYPARTGPLSERLVELIYVALDSSATHLFPTGLRTHMGKALAAGASMADILDVLHLVAVQGVARVGQAAAIVAEVAGIAVGSQIAPALQARIDRVAPSHALTLQAVAQMDPGYVEVLLDFIERGRPGDGLSPGERCLVQLALHACFTGFDGQALRTVAAAALAQGLEAAAMLQAVQLGAHLAVHGTALGVEALRAAREP